MSITYVNSIALRNTVFANNPTINSVDCSNIKWINDNMHEAFYNCSNLQNVSNINNNVTNMSATFLGCSNLVNVPVIPNSVTSMSFTFVGCSNLANAPVIPNSVTNMFSTFSACINLTGNVNIQSSQVSNIVNCFAGTLLEKNVYIPFKYDNGVYTQTYNSFINAGYSTTIRKDGVLLKNIKEYKLNVEDYTYTNTEGIVDLTEYIGTSATVTVPTLEEI